MVGQGDVRAAILVIGNEILSGRTQDANIGFLGARLKQMGIRLCEARVVADIREEIADALNALRNRYDYVFTTGGIGPTHDDITVDSVAFALGLEVVMHPVAKALLEDHYGDGITSARLRMARTPAGADLIGNPISKAPGIAIQNVFILAGVPHIMQAQFEALAPSLKGGAPMQACHIDAQLPESRLADALEKVQDCYADVEIGSYPYERDGRYGSCLVFRGIDINRLQRAAEEVAVLLRAEGLRPEIREGEGG